MEQNKKKKVLIIGAGPTGLGAAVRLQQLGHENWTLIDRESQAGGLARTLETSSGFHFDIGGHVIYSHYNYFNDLIEKSVAKYFKLNKKNLSTNENENDNDSLWLTHKRKAYIRHDNLNWIPFPFQTNFFRSNDATLTSECFNGLVEVATTNRANKIITNFQDLIEQSFGSGLCKQFMSPYNFKVWGHPLDQLSCDWIKERVATVDLNKLMNDFLNYKSTSTCSDNHNDGDDDSWGPNAFFRYPKYGGTGSIWLGASYLLNDASDNLKLNTELVDIDLDKKVVKFSNSNSMHYDYLISTMPIDLLVEKTIKRNFNRIFKDPLTWAAPKHSKVHIVGLGFESKLPGHLREKSWLYFPNLKRSPFYRVTIQSNHSPFMVPDSNCWSLLFEIAETMHLPIDKNEVVERTIEGALNENLIGPDDVDRIVTRFHEQFEYGYPTPYLERDAYLILVEPWFRTQHQVYSRGRFGGWKYEVSNQDHSLMQGVECVDNILFDCEEQTYFYPDHVNSRKETTRRFF